MLRDGALAADYNPTELDVAPGDRLEVLGIQGAWLHARDAARGRSGWIPAEDAHCDGLKPARVAPVTQGNLPDLPCASFQFRLASGKVDKERHAWVAVWLCPAR